MTCFIAASIKIRLEWRGVTYPPFDRLNFNFSNIISKWNTRIVRERSVIILRRQIVRFTWAVPFNRDSNSTAIREA